MNAPSEKQPSPRFINRFVPAAWDKLIVPIVFVGLIVVFAFANENYLSHTNLSNLLTQISVMAIVTVGASVVIFGGGFDLSAGSVVALSSVLGTMVMGETGSIPLGIVTAVGAGAAVGAINGTVVGYFGVSPLIATLGAMYAVRAIALLVSGGQAIYDVPSSYLDFGAASFLGIPVLAYMAAIVFLIVMVLLRYTPYGLKVYASGGNPIAATVAGVKVARVKLMNFMIAGATAGVGGILLAARTGGGEPTAGSFYELEAIAAVILGGAALSGGEGYLWRSMMGIALLGVIDNGLNIVGIHPYWKGFAVGMVLIGAASLDMWKKQNRSY